MYVDPFWFGVFSTISVELIAIVVIGLITARKKK